MIITVPLEGYRKISVHRRTMLLAAFGLIANHSTGLPTAAPKSPVIVKKAARVNQTAPIPTSTLYTPQDDALYRISSVFQLSVPTANNMGIWCPAFNWSDQVGLEQPTPEVACVVANRQPPFAIEHQTFTFRVKAGNPITYRVTNQNDTTGSTYSLYVVVERLP